ncbi:hypothetical protein F7984_03650 [Pradoshia sp. D12]|uniref:hypothetical protein n=1 Tax=Bacillaceae TaxID=186817 RepID=UPI00080AE41C|nr:MULTISPECIES: hypothetical protein [Bacillaceae]OCA90197.1 hypothetical protein A8L44_04565 [Bacillus sp. FJAT-27986]QFK70399.1 hypothetical protein F7984_03650 [Pradoshia sp. D12]TPF72193.1 hypothetical protein FHY44_00045 [Bacillus sp. D12]
MSLLQKWFYWLLAFISIIVFLLHNMGPYTGQLRLIAYILFTILCAALLIKSRESKAKIAGIIVFYLVIGIGGYF